MRGSVGDRPRGLADPDNQFGSLSPGGPQHADAAYPAREIVLFLSAGDPTIRTAAERALTNAPGGAHISPFLFAACGSSDPEVAGGALRIASARYAREGGEAAAVIRTALRHPQRAVKTEALRFLALLSPSEVSAHYSTEIEALSQESDEAVRSLAASIQTQIE